MAVVKTLYKSEIAVFQSNPLEGQNKLIDYYQENLLLLYDFLRCGIFVLLTTYLSANIESLSSENIKRPFRTN